MGHTFTRKTTLLAVTLIAPFLGACTTAPEIQSIYPAFTVEQEEGGTSSEAKNGFHSTELFLKAGVTCNATRALDTGLLQQIYADKGQAYRESQIVDWSYVKVPIVSNGQPRGNSRVWGDASHDTQAFVVQSIIDAGYNAGMNNDQVAMTIAIARHESGFNPDAAAGTTSAHGIGQFINRTGDHYGISNSNRWDVTVQANALVQHTLDNYAFVLRKGWSNSYVYALHHDGPSLSYGGLAIANKHVLPIVSFVQSMFTCE